MTNKEVKIIGWVLLILILINVWVFIYFGLQQAFYIFLFYVLVLFVIFRLLAIRVRILEKENIGLVQVLEKSEEGRMISEELKNKILMLIEDLPEGLLVINKNDEISIINSRAERFLGINKKQVLNKPVLELGHLSDVKKIVFPLLRNLNEAHNEEIQVRDDFILDLTIEPLRLGEGNIARLVTLYDVTKIKHAVSAKNQFISVTAHQLKTPLSATRLSLEMILKENFGKITAKQKNILKKTYKNNNSLIHLVESLLGEAKNNESGKSDKKSLISLEALTIPVAYFYRDEIKRKKIDFKFNKPDGKIPKVSADREKIKIVVQNLFDNAIKYTPIKGKIEVNITSKNGEVEFSIKDSGIGIPEDQKEKIFERFSRAVNAFKAKAAGSGLGLSIAKEIIEKNNGKIWFQSKENEGSTFFFNLPVVED